MRKITIIGAGIGGLTTAIALKQKGFEVEIFDQAKEFKDAGSGINLAINAMQVYKRLGLYDAIIENSHHTNRIQILNKKLKVLSKTNLKIFEDEFKAKNVAIHRAKLHKILLSNLHDTNIYLDKKLRDINESNNKVDLEFDDGSSTTSDLVIGADGIRSSVRKYVCHNSNLRNAKQVCWRGIVKINNDLQFKGSLSEAWSTGKRFGFTNISEDQIYWFALINTADYHKSTQLLDEFQSFHPFIKNLISKTYPNNIMINEIWDLEPINEWHKGKVCLLGDAAHATTPNMGQGAVQAIESAEALSRCLAEEPNFKSAFQKFQSIRLEKTHHITNLSWKIGKIAQHGNPIISKLRNLFLILSPPISMRKQNRKLYELNF